MECTGPHHMRQASIVMAVTSGILLLAMVFIIFKVTRLIKFKDDPYLLSMLSFLAITLLRNLFYFIFQWK